MKNLKDYFVGALVLVAAFGVFMTTYPPAREAMASPSPSASHAGHGTHSCDSALPLDPIDDILTVGGRPLVRLMVGNFSPTPVFLTSTNGNPAAQGWPICTDPLQCASAVSLSIFGAEISCSPAAGAVTVNVFGVR